MTIATPHIRSLIIDTSVLARYFFAHEQTPIARGIIERAYYGDLILAAPSLLLYEIASVFSKEQCDAATAKRALSETVALVEANVINLIEPDETALQEALAMAAFDTGGQGHISVYDATFHALAILNGATFITADKKHYNKSVKPFGHIELLEAFHPAGGIGDAG